MKSIQMKGTIKLPKEKKDRYVMINKRAIHIYKQHDKNIK